MDAGVPGPPDKRNAAYESIFGRPSASHHQHHGHLVPQPQTYYYAQSPDRRTSYAPSFAPSIHNSATYPASYRQPYSYSPFPANSVPRAHSIVSNPHAAGIIAPQPEEPPDPALQALTDSGLTPAQAYQAHVYSNSSSDLHPDASSDHDSNDSSELPWARRQPESELVPIPGPSSSSHPPDHSFAPNLHIDTMYAQSMRSSVISSSPTSFTLPDNARSDGGPSAPGARRSSESAHARIHPVHRDRGQDRAMSMSAASNSVRGTITARSMVASLFENDRSSPNSLRSRPRKTPMVYPALLSRVAEAFRDRITLADRIKDGLTYKSAFDGREAVDKIAYIIRTTDRNLALLLGRALDAQKYFHDVTYDHRLRDSSNELYQFRTKLPSPFVSGDIMNGDDNSSAVRDEEASPSTSVSPPPYSRERRGSAASSDEVELPSGVFTLLTDCYSPTCSRDQLCYSIACPRRLEQQARLNMKPQPGLSKQLSRESLNDAPDAGTLWIHSVPPEIVNSVSDTEKKRQEAINEVIYTERDFVRDMEYLRDTWIKRLQEQDIIPKDKRTAFLEQVFWNVFDIIAVNTRLRDALNKRQKSYAVVEKIGDILLDAVPHFGPFVSYGAHQLYGKYEFEKEKNSNPAFAQFVEATERLPESRKLELNAYLTKPTTRLARYPLLLEAVLKHTPEDSPDKVMLPQAILLIREFLAKVNAESGRTENRFNLIQLEQMLVFKPNEEVDLRLSEEGREMIYKGPLNKRDGELQVYLFDHALLFAKVVKTKQHEQYKVYRRPIPLELLLITASEDVTTTARVHSRKPGGLVRKGSFNKDQKGTPHAVAATVKPDTKGHWINFIHLGRKYYSLVLWANSQLNQRKWLEHILKQQQVMRERSMMFDTVPLSEGFFTGVNKVNCAAPFGGGRSVIYGTDDGVYISDLRDPNKAPVKVLALLEVSQVSVLEDYQLLIVLSERRVITFPLDALDARDPNAGLRRAKQISSHTSFFKAGYCLGRMLVCIVKSSQLSSTFKTLEPIDQNVRGRSKPTFKKLLQGGNDTLKPFREFYIPVESTSIHYLKTRMCVGCSRGFEIVDLETLDTQGLLDPHDESLEFVRKRDNLRPMAIFRIQNEFLLCYNEFAFYINKTGRRTRKEFMVHWEGTPTGFALYEPFVLAFEPSFIEIRHIDTGLMTQVIQGSNLRLLFAENPPSVTNQGTGMYNQGYEYNPYNPYAGGPQGYMGNNAYNRNSQAFGRDEIILVSDDRVLALRTDPGAQMQMQMQMR